MTGTPRSPAREKGYHRPGQLPQEKRSTTARGTSRKRCEGTPVCKVPPVQGAQGERHQNNKRGRLAWSGVRRTPKPESEGHLGKTLVGLKERRRAPSPKPSPIESAKESASAWEIPVGGAPRAPISPRNLDGLDVALSSRPTINREFQTPRFYLS